MSIKDSNAGDANFRTAPGSCSEFSVANRPFLSSCLAGSSLAVLLPAHALPGTVTAYVPEGYWQSFTTGVFVQNIEGPPSTASVISTPNSVSSCSSNPATQLTVCVGNNTDVYIISGTSLINTLTSAAKRNAKNVIVLRNPAVAQRYRQEWERLWASPRR